ncbi:MAG: RNA methyltransferase [Bacteroidetes bacterium]|nr:RNA methyltransferase [Bacteroidota bacterium]
MYLSQTEIKYLRSLKRKKFREIERKFLLEGWRPLRDALQSNYKIELVAVLSEASEKPEHRLVLMLARERGIEIKEIKDLQLKQISDAVHSQGVVALICQQENSFDINNLKTAQLVIACDRISDPGNLGTIIRTCDWFGADAVLLSEGCVSLFNDKVIRSTAGSVFHLNISENLDFESVLPNLKSESFKITATALNGKSINTYRLPDKVVLLLGNEAQGVNPKLIQQADAVVSIARHGKAESLNVGIACGIFLEHWRNRQ